MLAACSAGQGTLLPSDTSPQTAYQATTPTNTPQNTPVRNAPVTSFQQCPQPLIAGRVHSNYGTISCETVTPPPSSTNPIGPCVLACDGPPQNPDPCLKDPKLPGCGDGNPVATGDPEAGAQCDGSEAHGTPIELGYSNLPGGTSGRATTVVDIYSIQNAYDYTAGWIYTTANGDKFWEGNPNATSALDGFAGLLGPLASSILDAVNSPRQVSGSELSAIENAQSSGGYHAHHCFYKPLPA